MGFGLGLLDLAVVGLEVLDADLAGAGRLDPLGDQGGGQGGEGRHLVLDCRLADEESSLSAALASRGVDDDLDFLVDDAEVDDVGTAGASCWISRRQFPFRRRTAEVPSVALILKPKAAKALPTLTAAALFSARLISTVPAQRHGCRRPPGPCSRRGRNRRPSPGPRRWSASRTQHRIDFRELVEREAPLP